jgi:hypothetical protein
VTLAGGCQRRPDIVLCLDGLAIAVRERERSSVELAGGVRQFVTNQAEIFNKGCSPLTTGIPGRSAAALPPREPLRAKPRHVDRGRAAGAEVGNEPAHHRAGVHAEVGVAKREPRVR